MDMESPRGGRGTDGGHAREGEPGAELPRRGSTPDGGADGRRSAGQPLREAPPRPEHAPYGNAATPTGPPASGPGPGTGPDSPLADWLRAPRPETEPGIWRHGYRQLSPGDPDRAPTRQLLGAP